MAQLNNTQQFIQSFQDGKKLFPVMASVKVTRQVQKQLQDGEGETEGSQGAQQRINFTIVHAGDQTLGEAPTKSTMTLLPLLDDLRPDTSGIVPAALHMVSSSHHYTFEIRFQEGVAMPCQKIVSLLRSSQDSHTDRLGDGFKLTTTGVEDLLADTEGNEQLASKRYTVSAVCTVENLKNYKLDPPRGGQQHALVTISDVIEDTWVLDQVQLLSPQEATEALASLRALMKMAEQLHNPQRKRAGPWTDEFSPVSMAKKCKTLGRSPTDPQTGS